MMKLHLSLAFVVALAFSQNCSTLVADDNVSLRNADYVIQSGDILAVSIEPILPFRGIYTKSQTLPLVQGIEKGSVVDGYPIAVNGEGKVALPLIPPLKLAGMTIEFAEQKVASIYADQRLLKGEGAYPVFALLRSNNLLHWDKR